MRTPLPLLSASTGSLNPDPRKRPTQEKRNDYVRRLNDMIEHAYTQLLPTQALYQLNFDKCIRQIKQQILGGGDVYIYPTYGLWKTGKLQSPALGPSRVIRKDERTYAIDRNYATERINAYRVTYGPPHVNAPTKDENAATTEHLKKNTDGSTYAFDKLVTHRRKSDGTLEFLVCRYGYEKRTWEPRRNIPEELVSRYFDKRKTKEKRRSHEEDT